MRVLQRAFGLLALLCLAPATVWAQTTLAGAVRDNTGAVLPGVTVEAASPALIEKVRTAITEVPADIASRIFNPARTRSRSVWRASRP